MTQQDIINTVDPIAAKYGVPTFVWETVAEVESGLNPGATGDNGSSFGLFQLHRGGQLGNLTSSQAYDPATNANTAMPAIAAAWKKLSLGTSGPAVVDGTQYPGNFNWWYQFAVLSGHPGADTAAASAEATKLQAEAATLSNHPLPKASTVNTSQAIRTPYDVGSSGDCSILNPGACINDYINTNVVKPAESSALKVGIFLVALVLIIAGLWAVAS